MTETFVDLWQNTEQTILRTIDKITDENITKRIKPDMRSLGVIALHIGESQWMFAKALFGSEIPQITFQAFGSNANPEDITNAEDLKAFVKASCEAIARGIRTMADSAWNETVITPWKAELKRTILLNFMMGHSMQHLGQVIQALKYGS
jgi:uncharacterized damage-inducible protein DinB